MQKRRLGRSGLESSAVGLGCMAMSGVYGPADREESIATIRAAVEMGVTLLDTGDFYGMGHNEMLLGEALRGIPRDAYQLSVKFGAMRDHGGAWLGFDGRPPAVKNFLAYSLQRLGVDYVDIYRPARLDPCVPIEDTVGAIADCVAAGWVRHIGLSEVGPETIRRAAATHPICDLQIEYALVTRNIEARILPTCRELGICITAYGVLARGLIGGDWKPEGGSPGDFRVHAPRFAAENAAANMAVATRLAELARDYGLTGGQLAIAWAAAKGEDIVPLVGTRKRSRLDQALQAVSTRLAPEDVERIEAAIPANALAGERYAPAQMKMLDSEG